MIETIRYSMNGRRDILDSILTNLKLDGCVKNYPACSSLYTDVVAGTEEHRLLEEEIVKNSLRPLRLSFFDSTKEELATCDLFCSESCDWTDDRYEIVDEPAYSGRDACPECGKGSAEITEPLRGDLRKLEGCDLVRVPPGLVLGSARLVSAIQENSWTGVEVERVLERTEGAISESFSQLRITSILPAMHVSAPIERTGAPDFCEVCRRLGYQLTGRQPVYGRSVLNIASDWNFTLEWVAPHYVSCPRLICSRRVVHALLKLDPEQAWIPVKLID